MKKIIGIALLVSVMGLQSTMAAPGHGGPGPGRPGHGGPGPGPRPGHGHHGGGDDELVAAIFLSTSAIFMSEMSANQSQAVYVNADQEAALYLSQNTDEEPTSLALAQAIEYERVFLFENGKAEEAASLSNSQVAYLVLKRSEALQSTDTL
ncbi:MAG: hypothetical protein AAGB31_12445 [Bdellovibrio sp.]